MYIYIFGHKRRYCPPVLTEYPQSTFCRSLELGRVVYQKKKKTDWIGGCGKTAKPDVYIIKMHEQNGCISLSLDIGDETRLLCAYTCYVVSGQVTLTLGVEVYQMES